MGPRGGPSQPQVGYEARQAAGHPWWASPNPNPSPSPNPNPSPNPDPDPDPNPSPNRSSSPSTSRIWSRCCRRSRTSPPIPPYPPTPAPSLQASAPTPKLQASAPTPKLQASTPTPKLQALAHKSIYPADFSFEHEDEGEATFVAYRRELGTLFKGVARLHARLAQDFVARLLQTTTKAAG